MMEINIRNILQAKDIYFKLDYILKDDRVTDDEVTDGTELDQ